MVDCDWIRSESLIFIDLLYLMSDFCQFFSTFIKVNWELIKDLSLTIALVNQFSHINATIYWLCHKKVFFSLSLNLSTSVPISPLKWPTMKSRINQNKNLNLLMYIGNHNKNPSSVIHDERSHRMTKGSNAKLCGFSIRKSEYPYFIWSNVKFIVNWIFTSLHTKCVEWMSKKVHVR